MNCILSGVSHNAKFYHLLWHLLHNFHPSIRVLSIPAYSYLGSQGSAGAYTLVHPGLVTIPGPTSCLLYNKHNFTLFFFQFMTEVFKDKAESNGPQVKFQIKQVFLRLSSS